MKHSFFFFQFQSSYRNLLLYSPPPPRDREQAPVFWRPVSTVIEDRVQRCLALVDFFFQFFSLSLSLSTLSASRKIFPTHNPPILSLFSAGAVPLSTLSLCENPSHVSPFPSLSPLPLVPLRNLFFFLFLSPSPSTLRGLKSTIYFCRGGEGGGGTRGSKGTRGLVRLCVGVEA